MKISIFAYSRQGCRKAEEILKYLEAEEVQLYCGKKPEPQGFLSIEKPGESFYGDCFKKSDALIFVGSCGIAVRLIAPHIKSKTEDPAVIVTDELGKFVIPILSGHIGGANALAESLAEKISAQPVITTATDINGRFSPDSFAKSRGYIIDSMETAKKISALILEGDVGIKSELPITGQLPPGLRYSESGEAGIYIGCRKRQPFEICLRLIPKTLNLGIGCRKNTEEEKIAEAFKAFIEENNIDPRAIKGAASIDLKKEEPGLLSFCRNNNFELKFYSPEELMAAEGEFEASDFVKKITGADNVCERAAVLSGGKLLIKKTALNGVTLAISEEKAEVNFGKA